MNYLLHNRKAFYESLLPRIPDPWFQDSIRALLASTGEPCASIPDLNSDSMTVLGLDLEDAVKKPHFGEKLGKSVVSFREALNVALQIEDTCIIACSHLGGDSAREAIDSFSFTRRSLAVLRDDLRYHRVRLVEQL